MSRNRLWTLGLTAAIVLVAVFGYLLGVSPILSQASAADAQRDTIATANLASESRTVALKSQFANLDTVKGDLDKLRMSIPADSDMPVFLREVNTLVDQAGVVLVAVTVSETKTYVPPVVATPPAAASTGTATGTATPTPAPSGSTATAAAVTPAVPSGPSTRLQLTPVQISVSGPYAAVMAFIGALQSGERLYLANSVTVSSTPENPDVFTGSLIGFVYALPSDVPAGVVDTTGAAAGGEAAAPTK